MPRSGPVLTKFQHCPRNSPEASLRIDAAFFRRVPQIPLWCIGGRKQSASVTLNGVAFIFLSAFPSLPLPPKALCVMDLMFNKTERITAVETRAICMGAKHCWKSSGLLAAPCQRRMERLCLPSSVVGKGKALLAALGACSDSQPDCQGRLRIKQQEGRWRGPDVGHPLQQLPCCHD